METPRHDELNAWARLGRLLGCVDTDVEDVASSQDNVAVVGCGRIASVFCSPFKDYVHVNIRADHTASVFDIILEANADLRIQLLH